MLIKKLIRIIVVLLILIGICGGFWYHSSTIAPTKYVMQSVNVQDELIPNAFEGFKIGFISDFDLHTSKDLNNLEKCIEKLNQEKCHMVIFGGDLFENGEIFDEDKLISILKSIETTHGKLAVLGETDFLSDMEKTISLLEKSGFEVMRNQAHNIYYNDAAITFAGMEASGDVENVLSSSQKNNFVMVAVHQPDYFDKISTSSVKLQLSGHSGGGFIHLPIIGSTVKFEGATNYTHGHYTKNNCHLYITNGVGMGHEQTARFNCNPGATIITLHSTQLKDKKEQAPKQEEPKADDQKNDNK